MTTRSTFWTLLLPLLLLMLTGCPADDDDSAGDDDGADDDTGDDDAGDDDAGDDDAGDDDTGGEPESWIVTSGYSDQYKLLRGDDYTEVVAIDPRVGAMEHVEDAFVVPATGGDRVLFTSVPDGGDHLQYFSADPQTGDELVQLTDIANPGLGDGIPAGDLGVLFVGVPAAPVPILMTMEPGTSDPAEFRGAGVSKMVGGDQCDTTAWMSPAYAPNGNAVAAGWWCKDNNGPDLPAWTLVLAFEPNDDDCGEALFEMEASVNIEDVCFTYDSSLVIYSVGDTSAAKEVYVAKVDGSEDEVDITQHFNGGDITNLDCDPTSGRIVFNDLANHPDLFVLEYEVSKGTFSVTGAATQITSDGSYRRPRWVAAP